jgi:signal transduction histidine kinase
MPTEPRPPFRRRLLVTLGLALGFALAALGALVWLGAYVGLTFGARARVEAEAHEVASHVLQPDGRLDADDYAWDQPHHRFLDPHIDPYFVRVFDARGRLLRTSENVARLRAPMPAPAPPGEAGLLRPLRPFSVGAHRLYAVTEEVVRPDGAPVGLVEVARYDPELDRQLLRIGLGLGAGFLLVWAALLGLVWAVGGRVVRPLEAITASAQALSPEHLEGRVPVPPDADGETAELAEALNVALARIEDAFREVRRFTADAAHELQTPLTVMLGHVDVALRRERDPAAYRETLRLLHGEIGGLTQTVRGLLALARLEGSRQALEVAPVDFPRLVEGEVEAVRRRAEERGLALRLTTSTGGTVLGHEPLLREVVRNLLDNAVKYTQAGEVAVRVEEAGSGVHLVVADTGPGIPEEDLPHVTARLHRARSVQHVPGSGLGLALVQQVVRHHGGVLSVASVPGQGTTVTIVLPRHRAESDLIPAQPNARPPLRAPQPAGGPGGSA